MREGEFAHLRRRGLDQFLVAVAERGAPQPGHALDIAFAVGVVDIDALPTLDNERALVAKAREIDVRVQHRFDVAGRKIAKRHLKLPSRMIPKKHAPDLIRGGTRLRKRSCSSDRS